MLSRRRAAIAFAAITIPAGLVCRRIGLPGAVSKPAGDVLWAMLVLFLIAAVRPKSRLKPTIAAALLFSYAIEFSQIYHRPWIDSIRRTTLGGLVLGFTFSRYDLLSYTIGVALAAVVLLVTAA